MANEVNMIAACPRCKARYRIESSRLQPEGVRLRCSNCDAVFRVKPAAAAAPEPAAPEPARPSPSRTEPEPPARPREPLPRPPGGAVVVVADSDVDAGKRTAHALSDWGYTPVLVHDGVEAVLTIQRLMPRAVVLDAALPKMFGFQICELMKRNESLSAIQVVLVGAIHHQARYRREPSDLYGADAYIERPQLPEALRAVLRGFGVGPEAERAPAARSLEPVVLAAPGPAAQPPAPPAASVPQPGPAVVSPPASRPPATESPEDAPAEAPEHAAAERLARIIVSDILLYNAEKFEEGLRSGDVVGALAAELGEGRTLLAQRVPARVREQRDFLAEELLKVARSRGGNE